MHDSCKSSGDVKLYLCLPAREQPGQSEAEEAERGHHAEAEFTVESFCIIITMEGSF